MNRFNDTDEKNVCSPMPPNHDGLAQSPKGAQAKCGNDPNLPNEAEKGDASSSACAVSENDASLPGRAKGDAPKTPAPESAPDPAPPKDSIARAKKLLVTLVVALIVLLLLNLIPFDRLSASLSESSEETEPVATYGDNFFKIPDYDEDVTEDTVYQTKYNLLLTYESGGEAFSVTAQTAEAHGPVCVLFQRYLEALMAGDTAACDALFSDAYLQKNGHFTFAPQKIYDMKVKVKQTTYLENGDASGAYQGYNHYYCEVSYKIRDNNGTLRRDFYEEGVTVPQIYEVVEKDGVAQITMISAIRVANTSNEWKGISIMMYTIWIAVMALAIVVEASSATLVAIWFMPGALVSLILALCGLEWQIQLVVFFLLSLVLTVVGVLFFRKRMLKKKPTPTNVDRVINMEGVVSEAIDNLAAKGEVKADGKRWSARSEDGSPIEEGVIVTVLRIEGVKLIVKKK